MNDNSSSGVFGVLSLRVAMESYIAQGSMARPSNRQLGKQLASTRAADENVPSPVHKRHGSGCS